MDDKQKLKRKLQRDEQLDVRWFVKRSEILARDGYRCQHPCHGTAPLPRVVLDDGTLADNMLEVHHRRYYPGRKKWEYDSADLVTYCARCHRGVTLRNRAIRDEVFERLFRSGQSDEDHERLLERCRGRATKAEGE